MKLVAIVTLSLLATLSSGCSSSDDPQQPSSSSGTSSSGGEAAAEAPKLTEVAKMMGALHVMWTNPAVGCESIELERKATMADGTVHEEYAVAYTLPGAADNKHDTSATEDMDYTYRLRCKIGGTYSKYSNEMTQNPTK